MENSDIFTQSRIESIDEHAKSIGNVTIAWNTAQSLVWTIFGTLSNMPHENAKSIFFTLKSDAAQREITIALARTELSNNLAVRKSTIGAISELTKLSGERNAAIHTMWSILQPDKIVTPSPSVPHHKKLDLDNHEQQFQNLEHKIGDAIGLLLEAYKEICFHYASQNKPK